MTRLSSEEQVLDFVRAARASANAFEIVGGGTRRGAGRPMGDLPVADVGGLSGIVSYQPEELILTVRPGTKLDEIKAVLAEKNQCLGFDPVDWAFLAPSGLRIASAATATSPAYAPHAGEADLYRGQKATIGGAISADASGSGRLRHGAARDSLLGFRAVNGFGEAFNAGGKVVKNVTGFDLPKLVCGAFGTLCVLTELTFRVFPRPRFSATLMLKDLPPEQGFAALRKIWQSALEPSGLAYLPGGLNLMGDVGQGVALVRLEAEEKPLAEKCAAAQILVGACQPVADGDALFARLGAGVPFAAAEALDIWRLFLPPSQAAGVAATLAPPLWYGDWAGGLLWAGMPGEGAARVRAVARDAGGHAMLLRATADRRAALGPFAPQPAALAAISARVKAAFDPLALFNPGRI
jgi:glycolate oxidase FAD binding subunit